MSSPERIHEADNVLARRLLRPGTEAYRLYYEKHPEFREADDRAREAAGLLSPESKYYQRGTFTAADTNFDLLEHLAPLSGVDGNPNGDPIGNPNGDPIGNPNGNPDRDPIDPASEESKIDSRRSAAFIENWLLRTGAHQVGFTKLQAHHLYSHKGRGPRAGEEIQHRKETAIAITVEMSHEMLQPAPQGSIVMESSEQYLRSAILALKAATWIRKLGYKAMVHMDGHYEVICPLVAADAGLGVIGRMGLLITPRLGPRVRIAVITTDMPLAYKSKKPDLSVTDFCKHCKKCARLCPSAAIPFDGPETENGQERWKISSERCYQYWCTSGTDCGRCVSTCPYSHRNNLFHNLIRLGIKNNLLFRRLAVKLDDLFYGRKPAPARLPDWTDIEN